ncbi:MAG TPA: 6-carboxytetrahydropterin synthase [Planctomycetota bacterium]|nr:6-carboxytetrahydropterin synthase [Planctomycetota bacterium]
MFELRRTYRFCASHRFWRDDWSDDRNLQVFGKCALPHGHGHNYRFTLTIAGDPDPETGMTADLAALDALVAERVEKALDHRNLNAEVPEFKTLIPTGENLAKWIFDRVAPLLPRGELVEVSLQSDEALTATYRPHARR